MRTGTKLVGVALFGLTLASACGADPTTDPSVDEKITGDGAHVLRATDGALTAPSTAAPTAIASRFVADRTGVATDALVVDAAVPGRGGITHVRLSQTVDGVRVAGAYAKVAISSRGEVLQSIDHLAAITDSPAPATIGARQALSATLAHLGYPSVDLAAGQVRGAKAEFLATRDFHRNPTVERVIYVAADGLRIGFEVETWSRQGNQLDYTLVGSDGAIVSVEHRTNNDAYNVFVEDPAKGPQTVINGPGAGNAESPSGWLAGTQTTINISGNNAHAYLDTDANNAPDSGGTAVNDGNFLTAVALSVQPSTVGNKAVAVQNLAYFNNTVHDILYRHGFNEAAGNFQTNNFGQGGAGNDPVQAEAQDGSGTDNANFSTPNDGSAPRMQMYLWSGVAPTALVTIGTTDYAGYASSFGAAPTLAGTTGPLAIMSPADGCTAAAAGSLNGKIAIIDRGTCNFTVKVLNAQKAGAVAAVIANNAAGAFAPGGTERRVKISSAMVSQADGATLRMQLGASTKLRKNPATPIQIDGDIDSDIVFHEYGHGLTWRMIGSMSGKLAGAIGEGASDVNAFLINHDPIVGEYAYSNAAGIRRYSYAGYPLTYSAVTGAEVHNDGEIYAGAMWKVTQNYLAAGLTLSDVQDDFVDGMNFTPAAPAFEDMRDGMLQGATAVRACLIWRGFASSGIGVGADGRLSQNGTLTVVESFVLPPGC